MQEVCKRFPHILVRSQARAAREANVAPPLPVVPHAGGGNDNAGGQWLDRDPAVSNQAEGNNGNSQSQQQQQQQHHHQQQQQQQQRSYRGGDQPQQEEDWNGNNENARPTTGLPANTAAAAQAQQSAATWGDGDSRQGTRIALQGPEAALALRSGQRLSLIHI